MIVLDASAVLAVLFDEAGADRVASVLGEAVLCSVNLAEVVSKLVDRAATPQQRDAVVGQFAPMTRAFTAEMGVAAGLLRKDTRGLGLSLGDRSCLALAKELGVAVMTADRTWAERDFGIEIEVIR